MRPTEACAKWINDQGGIPAPDVLSKATLYMVPELEYTENVDIEKILLWFYRQIFKIELWGWYTKEALSPMEIDFEKFREWFDCEYIDMCYDLSYRRRIRLEKAG